MGLAKDSVVDMDVEGIAAVVVDAAFKVHRVLGPGLLESVYQLALFHELTTRGLHVLREVPVPIAYEGVSLGTAFRIDLLVEDCIIVECKAVDKMNPIFEAQILTYMRLAHKPMGFLINYHEKLFKNGVKRYRV